MLLLREKLVYTAMFFILASYATLNLVQAFDASDIIETEAVEETDPLKQIFDTIDEIDYNSIVESTMSDAHCLATNIYFEARGESEAGQIAVAFVTLNRVRSSNFPNDICDVVYQAQHSEWWKEHKNKLVPIRHRCQFSWYCDGKSDKIHNEDEYVRLLELAFEVLMDNHTDNTGGAVYYHADYVEPYWAIAYNKTTSIDDHVFYRE
tara:strand:+ start:235 stop:855 length:621 start_codon:yes stop_codon:yes gene_type:complete